MSSVRIFKHHIKTPYVVLGCIELLLFFISVFCAIWLRFDSLHPESDIELLAPLNYRAALTSSTFIICMYAMGLYQSTLREGLSGFILRVTLSFVFASVALSLFFFLIPELIIGRVVFFISVTINIVTLLTTRYIFSRLVDEKLLRTKTVVLGAGKRASRIAKRFRRKSDRRGFKVVGYIPGSEEEPIICKDRSIYTDLPLSKFCKAHHIEEVVVAVDDRRKKLPVSELLECKLLGISVIDDISFFEKETGKIEVDLLTPGWMIFSDGFHTGTNLIESRRLFDIFISIIFLIITTPLMIATAIAIKLEDGQDAQVLYRQKRAGLAGKTFMLLKFRSMITNAEADGAVWASQNDSRITKTGKFIRKYRIDELPQIFNVLKGDMSFVGPRPERPEFIEKLKETIPYYDERHRVKPGIAGWAQLCYPYGATIKDSQQKFKYDLYYVKNHSLFLDILILIQTAEVVLFGKGAR